jgi:hypothetical protein
MISTKSAFLVAAWRTRMSETPEEDHERSSEWATLQSIVKQIASLRRQHHHAVFGNDFARASEIRDKLSEANALRKNALNRISQCLCVAIGRE